MHSNNIAKMDVCQEGRICTSTEPEEERQKLRCTQTISLKFCWSQAETVLMEKQEGTALPPYAIVFNTCQVSL